jgi:hypothetical protein
MSKALFAVGFVVFLISQQTLNNESVVGLMRAGFAEDVIIGAINRSLGAYDTSVDALVALKKAGITDKEIAAIVAKAASQKSAAQVVPVAEGAPVVRAALPVPVLRGNKPRVFLRARSHGSGWHESRDQAMEMSKDFLEVCPEVQVSVNQNYADYTVELNHSEYSFVRLNQIQVANKDGDLVSGGGAGGSIKGDVKKACEAIVADWAKK